MFEDLLRKLVDAGRQAKVENYEESKQTVDVYTEGWQSRLTTLTAAIAVSSAAAAHIVQSASNTPCASAAGVQTGSCFQGYARAEYQIDAEPDSAGARLKPSSF